MRAGSACSVAQANSVSSLPSSRISGLSLRFQRLAASASFIAAHVSSPRRWLQHSMRAERLVRSTMPSGSGERGDSTSGSGPRQSASNPEPVNCRQLLEPPQRLRARCPVHPHPPAERPVPCEHPHRSVSHAVIRTTAPPGANKRGQTERRICSKACSGAASTIGGRMLPIDRSFSWRIKPFTSPCLLLRCLRLCRDLRRHGEGGPAADRRAKLPSGHEGC